MEIIRMMTGVYAANCYIVYSEDKGIIIDPGGDVEDIVKKVEELGVDIEFILLTHGHGDHIGGVAELKEILKVPAYINEEDEYMTQDPMFNLSASMPSGPKTFEADKVFKDGNILKAGKMEVEVIHTPGHTPGGSSFKIDNNIFTGDTLFKGSIGRTDFPKSSLEEIMHSVKEVLAKYPDDTVVYPGHGPSTTIGEEKTSNPFMRTK